MGIIKTKGIILLESNMGDFDKMVSILTPDIGKIGCAAKGARKPKSPLMAGTQFLSFSDLVVYSDVTDENQYTYKILQLLLNTLYIISETDVDKDFILSVFELRLMVLLGYSPRLGKCVSCGSPENICYFSIAHSGFLCNNCGRVDKSAIQITKDTFDALKYICTAPAKKIYSFNVSDESKKELQIISSLYLNKNLDKDYKFEKIF